MPSQNHLLTSNNRILDNLNLVSVLLTLTDFEAFAITSGPSQFSNMSKKWVKFEYYFFY